MDKLLGGIENLAQAAIGGIMGITVVVTVALVVITLVKKQANYLTEDQREMHNTKIKEIILNGILIFSAEALVSWILSFFG